MPGSYTSIKYSTLLVTQDGKITVITLNRPTRKNACTPEMFKEVPVALLEAENDDDTSIVVITGAGDYFTSGNDLSNFTTRIAQAENMTFDQIQGMAREGLGLVNKFVKAFIDFKKPLVAIVNGPAIGIGTTILGLFDLVYASDRAIFYTPFSALGQSPEGCSSYLFPRLMGFAKASELLCFNRKISAKTACDWGLVTEVFPDSTLHQEVWPRLRKYSTYAKKSMIIAKELQRYELKDILHRINDEECERLVERSTSDDCMNAIMNFFSSRNSKL